jgi:hypothetical protein
MSRGADLCHYPPTPTHIALENGERICRKLLTHSMEFDLPAPVGKLEVWNVDCEESQLMSMYLGDKGLRDAAKALAEGRCAASRNAFAGGFGLMAGCPRAAAQARSRGHRFPPNDRELERQSAPLGSPTTPPEL